MTVSSQIPTRTPSAAWQRIDGELVILHQDAEQLLGLNPIGALVWELIDGSRSVAEIAAQVSATYPEAKDCTSDVDQFVQQLVAAALVTLR